MIMKGRKLMINGQEWRWAVGRKNVAARCIQTGEKRFIDFSRLTGVSWYDIERARHKQTTFRILPSQVTRWLTLGSDTFTASPSETKQALGQSVDPYKIEDDPWSWEDE